MVSSDGLKGKTFIVLLEATKNVLNIFKCFTNDLEIEMLFKQYLSVWLCWDIYIYIQYCIYIYINKNIVYIYISLLSDS